METTSVSDGAVLYEVMRHAEWRIKAAFPLLCRQCLQQSRQQSHWDFLARCLQADFLLHVPAITGLVTRELFLELWLTRHLFVPAAPRPRLLAEEPEVGGEPADDVLKLAFWLVNVIVVSPSVEKRSGAAVTFGGEVLVVGNALTLSSDLATVLPPCRNLASRS